ncbi:hypothetical protein SAMN05421678_112140 [Actinopolymorpha cephalotaxi]|uniref:Membrane associated rhomboid family serine protease n=1 Tax=Actinopolymorpha cephalotaxi TaxID=504797 RepID=A0A1I2XDT1_9ACTN|nr:hypothetical protein [Actinopolymorpha cephalotaxi]NYH86205.1 membrane associated rhomboid family serine protease [Actinopolymorpha cephalotaxi]SFH11625.1 hypothetical protein SAMN05421678_112140 [Actinopolymorpha cephalotaxi]
MSEQVHASVSGPGESGRNGFGLASLTLGIIGLSIAWIPLWGFLAVVLGAAGLVLALLGFVRLRRGRANNASVAIAGGTSSLMAVLVALFAFKIMLVGFEFRQSYLENAGLVDPLCEKK